MHPADLTREITQIQQQLTNLAADKTRALSVSRKLDIKLLEKFICDYSLVIYPQASHSQNGWRSSDTYASINVRHLGVE